MSKRQCLTLAGLAFFLACWQPRLALACAMPTDRAVYQIHHQIYGDIGRHVVNFRCKGDDLVVETDIEVEVKLLFLTVYRRSARQREIWRDDKLIAYEARTEEDGDIVITKARVEDDQMVVDGLQGRIAVPLDTVSSHPWNEAVIEREVLFDMKDGELLHVEVASVGEEILDLGGKKIKARKYLVSGDLERELWYDETGNWLQWRLYSNGDAVTISRR